MPLSNGDVGFTFQQLCYAGLDVDATMLVQDLWAYKDLGSFTDKFAMSHERHCRKCAAS